MPCKVAKVSSSSCALLRHLKQAGMVCKLCKRQLLHSRTSCRARLPIHSLSMSKARKRQDYWSTPVLGSTSKLTNFGIALLVPNHGARQCQSLPEEQHKLEHNNYSISYPSLVGAQHQALVKVDLRVNPVPDSLRRAKHHRNLLHSDVPATESKRRC